MDSATAEWTPDTAAEPDGTVSRRRHGAWPAALLLAGVSAVVGCRAADSDGITPVPQLLAFLPWLAAPTVLALLLAALARWRSGLLWGVLVLGTIAWFIEPYGRVGEPQGKPVADLRVLTSNVEFGRATAPLIAAVSRERPDLVFVEECDHGCSAALDKKFGQDTYPYRSGVEASGSEGSLILSRYPLKATPGVRGTMGMPGAVVEVRGHAVRLQLAHPMPPLPDQLGTWRSELGALRDFAAAEGTGTGTGEGGGKGASDKKSPTIIAGDFNASQDHAAFRRILDTGLRDGARLAGEARDPSWPARTAPMLGAQIDHVLVSEDFSARDARFLHLADTDHRALLVDLTLHAAAGTAR